MAMSLAEITIALLIGGVLSIVYLIYRYVGLVYLKKNRSGTMVWVAVWLVLNVVMSDILFIFPADTAMLPTICSRAMESKAPLHLHGLETSNT